MLKYASLLAHITITDNSFKTLEKFDTEVSAELKHSIDITKYVIKDNQLYFDCFGNCSLYSLYSTEYFNGLLERQQFKNTLFYLITDDGLDYYHLRNVTDPEIMNTFENVPAFMFNRDTNKTFEKSKYLLPDPYIFHPEAQAVSESWADAIDMITTRSEEISFNDKISKIFWIGAPHAPTRESYKGRLYDYKTLDYLKQDPNVVNIDSFPRVDLVKLSAKHPNIINAKLAYGLINDRKALLNNYTKIGYNPYDFYAVGMSPNFHLNYKYLISLDGMNAAWGRVPWIMFSNSLLIKDDSTKEQWFYPLFKDKVNTVMVDPTKLENLIEIFEWCEQNEEKVLEIIENQQEVANNYFRPEAVDEFTIEALNKYTDIIGEKYFDYKLGNNLKGGDWENLTAAADNLGGYIPELKPGHVFKVLDLPIINQFLLKHGGTFNKLLFSKDIALYQELDLDLDQAEKLFKKSEINQAFIKNFFKDRSIIKRLIGVDLADFIQKVRVKFEADPVFLKQVESMIEEAMKIKNFVEGAAIAGLNFIKKKEEPYTEDL